jgi:hypothetical protein
MQSTKDACWDQGNSTKEILTEVWEAIDADVKYEDQDAREYLQEMPLEIVWELGEEFAVVLGTGGPHVEITGGGRSGSYKLTVYWAGEKATVSGAAITRTGEYFREMVEEG